MFELFGILFLTIIAPLWIIFHFISKNREMNRLKPEDEKMMSELWDSARRMEERIHTLERILETEAPGWRGRT